MAQERDAVVLRRGAIALAIMAVVLVSAFNLQKFPGFKGTDYRAEFADAGGLHVGSIVQIAGIKVGRVNGFEIQGDKVVVKFDVHDAEFGPDSTAAVEVLNLLGEKYLQINPKGSGQLAADGVIPLKQTDVAYDIVGTLSELTTRTEKINTNRLSKALSVLGDALNASAPEVQQTFTGISRISKTIASRDKRLSQMLTRANSVTKLLVSRRGDLTQLMKRADLVFKEIKLRRAAIHRLLVSARRLAVSLEGVVADNKAQMRPALQELKSLTTYLESKKGDLDNVLNRAGPYVRILSNVLGTGPWFDSWVPNFASMATGEFVPVVK